LRPRRNRMPRNKDESKLKAADGRVRNASATPPNRAEAARSPAPDAAVYP